MELSEFIEFISVKNLKVACQFEIETKEFKRFKKSFITHKYLSVIQWEEIERNLQKIIQKQMKLDKDRYKDHLNVFNLLPENSFTVDDYFDVQYKVLPKDESYVNFARLKFSYWPNWVMSVKITRLAPVAPVFVKPEIVAASSEVAEYDPNQYETLQSKYTPSNKKQALDNKTSPEYSPRSINNSGSGSSNKYTPSKINNNDNENECEGRRTRRTTSKNMRNLFGESSSDENVKCKSEDTDAMSTEERVDSEKPVTRKRQLLANKDEVSAQKKPHASKKVKSVQPGAETWLIPANNETPSKITQRPRVKTKPEKSSVKNAKPRKIEGNDPTVVFDHGKMLKMETFLERSKQTEMNKNQRKFELKDYEIWNCNDLSRADLKTLVREFAPSIRKLFDNSNAVSLRNQKYNPVLITTSNVLTENQIDFVCSEIENQRDADDRGYKEDVLTDIVLPEFIIHVFSSKFSLSKEEALERFRVQEERHALYNTDDLLL